MAELHSNQVAWSAPEPIQVSLAQKQDYIGREVQQLGNLMDRFAEIKADIDDTAANEDMNLAAKEALAELQKYKPDDNNYGPAKTRMMSTLESKLNSMPEDVRNRFVRSNPEFMARQELTADEVIFEKQQQFTQKKIVLTAPMIASRVSTGEISYEQGKEEVRKMVANTPSEFADEVLFNFDKSITVARLDEMIMAGMFDDAETLVSDVNSTPTLEPQERIAYKGTIAKSRQAVLEQKEKARKAILDSSGDMEKDLLLTALNNLDKGDDSIVKFMKSLDNKKETITTTTGVKVSVADISPLVRRNVLSKLEGYLDDNEAFRQNSVKTEMRANTALTNYKKSILDETTDSQIEYNNLVALRESSDWYYLSKDTKKEVVEHIERADNRLLDTILTTTDEANYYWLEPPVAAVTSSIIGGAATGAAITKNVYGAITGAAIGALAEASGMAEHTAPTGLATLNDSFYNRSLTTGVKLSPLKKPTNRAETLLEDPQRAYRTATTRARDEVFLGDKQIRYGTASEFILNLGTKLIAINSQGQNGREQLGIPYTTDKNVVSAINAFLGDLQATKRYDVILQEIKDPATADKFTRQMFNSFIKYLAKDESRSFTEEQKVAQENIYQELISATKGHGGAIFSNTPTELAIADEDELYRKDISYEQYIKGIKEEFD